MLVVRAILLIAAALTAQPQQVGPQGTGATVVTTGQLVRPAGTTIEFPARPVDFVLSRDGQLAYVKENQGITVLETNPLRIRQRLDLGDNAASMTGIALTPDGATLLWTDATTGL